MGILEARDSFEPNIQTTPVEEILEVGARGFYVNAGSKSMHSHYQSR
ncbi:hypothetical protein MGH68_15035 [Erysipelothrix sp. D19-032]